MKEMSVRQTYIFYKVLTGTLISKSAQLLKLKGAHKICACAGNFNILTLSLI
jgi:hypothetical protein